MNNAHHKPISSKQREKQRALALAAITQAAYLVECIVQEGRCDRIQFEHTLDALLVENFTANHYFSLGSNKAKQLLQGHEIKHARHILSHTATLLSIEKKLTKQPKLLETIALGMVRIHKQAQYFGDAHHANVISSIAHLYGETVSTINPRVIIRGKPEHIKQAHHTDQVRCLLFSGIRAAWVWRTHGGNAMSLIFGRKKLIKHLGENGMNT